MQGYLDHLEATGHVLPRKVWTRRFFRLNDAFHGLEVFMDAAMERRTMRLELAHAQIATADELGELLFCKSKPSAKIPIENSRRFVFRVAVAAEGGSADTPHEFHYLCAELPVADAEDAATGGVDAAASRKYMDQWLRALRATALKASTPAVTVVSPVDLRDLNVKMAQYMSELHVSAHVTARRENPADHHKGQYEITVQAWTLQRELVRAEDAGVDDANANGDHDHDHDQLLEWQVLEYSASWHVAKSSAQLRDFDSQLRLLFRDELRDLALPSFAGVRAFLQHKKYDDDESERRVALYNAYLSELLCLPAFSVFASDGGTMLDTFLELSPHLAAFKKLEASSGQSLKLRQKRVVPWRERERFEQLYNLHVEMVRAQDERRQQQRRQQRRASAQARAAAATERDKAERAAQHHHQNHNHHHHHHRSSTSSSTSTKSVRGTREKSVVEASPPLPVVVVEEQTDSVHERIARIGHKLLVEAFQSPGASPKST